MKKAMHVAAVLGLLVASSTLYAGETYGPVLKIKPKGVAAESPSKPQPAKNVDNGQPPKPTGLLLPAVQKARDASNRNDQNKPKPETGGNTVKNKDQGIGGGLDRDIIRQIPSKPKPKN